MYPHLESAAKLTGVAASRAFFAPCFALGASDELLVAHVDDHARCVHLASYSCLNFELPVQAILAEALQLESTGLVLAQAQSGGESGTMPRLQAATQRLATAADAIKVTVLDHLIFAGDECTSLRRQGLL